MGRNPLAGTGSSEDSGIGKHLEKIGGLDLITAVVLGIGAYTIYSGLNYTQSLFSVSLEPTVIAVQLSGLMAIVYLLEFRGDEENEDQNGYKHSVGQRLEKMASMDALTLAALALNAYVLYEEMSFFTLEELMEPGGSLMVIALQASAILAVVYILEFKDDSE